MLARQGNGVDVRGLVESTPMKRETHLQTKEFGPTIKKENSEAINVLIEEQLSEEYDMGLENTELIETAPVK